jgi:Ca2+-binding RTX toxin-like protein
MLNKKGLATLSLFVTILSCISLIITGSSKSANDVSSDNLFSTNQANGMAASHASYKNTINVGDSDPETDSFTSSRSSVVSSFPPTVVPGANLGPDLSGNIELLINLLQTNGTNLLSSFLSSKCIASAIAAGSSNITTEGNLIIGTNCDDVIHGTKGDAIIYTLAGNDRADGDGGNDIIYAGDGDDRLYGGKGNDIIVGKGEIIYLIVGLEMT